ncbi:MAG: hypothetical protein PHC35_04610 [Deltaproteobacteria bacterium]|nr:hypothetical protein [Deltaproteobacteria bacterium]
MTCLLEMLAFWIVPFFDASCLKLATSGLLEAGDGIDVFLFADIAATLVFLVVADVFKSL